ncbi:uncharacterized protein HME9304_02834 [Flagellimonas maritima]|uniref:Uncharacterized protein n=1 Tax=Flagellimonas maritima TaxID=1383885 RepID=A0A2Z4LWB1_9FLAO|nr:right-handed parallel beta-helix repeat-containing protein [Allomuricauda aurantiaca]AWX45804.1 uncharacterized protein HME9304_02834 [Allomuricauda aurantiaca]
MNFYRFKPTSKILLSIPKLTLNYKTTFCILFLNVFIFSSCSAEDVFLDAILEKSSEDQEDSGNDENDEDTNSEDENRDSFKPDTEVVDCDSTFFDIEANSTLLVNCNFDLKGAHIKLPTNISLLFEGGSIYNGALTFNGGVISGELLNTDLEIDGQVSLENSEFTFDKNKWNIKEGKVSDDTAFNNLNSIKDAIALVERLNGDTFEIDEIDAYFDVSRKEKWHEEKASIAIPSDFHFKMGSSCTLRVQPNEEPGYALLYIKKRKNVVISGGKLVGDRFSHDYSSGGAHDWGHTMVIDGVHNITVDGVEMREGASDGLVIEGVRDRNRDGSLVDGGQESYNVIIKNSLFDNNRRNNIAIVDGTKIYIEQNTIRNAGSGVPDQGFPSSNGTSPRAGIDIESRKYNYPDGNSLGHTEKTEDVHIRNNNFSDNYGADVALFNNEKTYVYENTFHGTISSAYSFNCKIYDNTFINDQELSGTKAISFEPRYWANGEHRTTNFEIYNNSIEGYQFGIVLGGQDNYVHNNILTNNQRGIILLNSVSNRFENNDVSSSLPNSYGYFTFSSNNSLKDITIKNSNVDVEYFGLFFSNDNEGESGEILIDNLNFDNNISLRNAHGITIKNSSYNNISITDCQPILINNVSRQ